jgi:hypothetical protein
LSDFIPTYKAWNCIAKMLFPDVDLVGTLNRDRWLIKHYPRPTGDITFKNQPASLLPGGITYVTGFQQAGRPAFAPAYEIPAPLIAEVDQAYMRQSLRKKVALWFTQGGFDVTQRTISKAALLKAELSSEAKAEIAAIPADQPEDPTPAPTITNAMIDDHVRGCFELVDGVWRPSASRPSQAACVEAWKAKHGSAARRRVRDRYNAHAKKLGIIVKEGRPQKLAQ